MLAPVGKRWGKGVGRMNIVQILCTHVCVEAITRMGRGRKKESDERVELKKLNKSVFYHCQSILYYFKSSLNK
jgi:hypothetical protein